MSKLVGYVVTGSRYGKSPLTYIGEYGKDGRKHTLFNGIGSATIFASRAAAKKALTLSRQYWTQGSEWDMTHWNIVSLYPPKP